MTYLEILAYSVLDIIEEEGINPISRIEVSEDVMGELLYSRYFLKQVIGYPIVLRIGMTQPYRIFRKRNFTRWSKEREAEP